MNAGEALAKAEQKLKDIQDRVYSGVKTPLPASRTTRADGLVKGQRIAGARSVSVRRHHGYLMPGCAQRVGQVPDSRGIHAIIVAYQYAHRLFPLKV